MKRENTLISRLSLNKRNIITLLATLLLALYLGLSLGSPGKMIRSLGEEAPPYSKTNFVADSQVLSLQREKTFLEARLALATGDSIGLVINLPDSSIALEIKGVTLHMGKIERSEAGRFFGSLNHFEYSQLTAAPARIIKQQATIDKIPIRIVDAPTDSAGVALTMFVPDTSYSGKVHLTLKLGNGVRLKFIDSESGKTAIFLRDARYRSGDFVINLFSVIRLKIPDYHPVIRIYMNGDEIRTIYRAIPEKGMVVIRPIA